MMKTKAKHLWLPLLAVCAMLLFFVPLVGQHAAAEVGGFHVDHSTAQPWRATGGAVSGGNYYMDETVLSVSDNIVIEGVVNLCLNGQTLALGSCNIQPATGAVLNICDCKGGGVISCSGSDPTPVILISSTSKREGAVHLYSGTIDGTGRTAIKGIGDGYIGIHGGTVRGWGGIAIDESCELEITGGAVESTGEPAITVSGSSKLSLEGGRVYSEEDVGIRMSGGSISLSGAPSIGSGSMDDIKLAGDIKIGIGGPLTYQDDPISVRLDDIDRVTIPYQLTNGWSAHMPAGVECSDYFVGSEEHNEYKIDEYVTPDGTRELQLIGHTHSWSYAADPENENKIIATCTKEDGLSCTAPEGGFFTVSLPSELIYDGDEKPLTLDLTGLVTDDTLTVSYANEDGAPGVPCAVGTYTATVTVSDPVSGREKVQFSWPLTVSFLDPSAVPQAVIGGETRTVNGVSWYIGDVTIAVRGYTVSASLDGTYEDVLTVRDDMDGTEDFVYYVKNNVGQYGKGAVTLHRDTGAPVFEGNPTVSASDTSCTITVSVSDLVGVEAYTVKYWQAGQASTTVDGLTLSGLAPNSQYFYTITATDWLGNAATVEGSFMTAKSAVPSDARMTFDQDTYIYNGGAHIPGKITLTWAGHTVTVDDEQFDVVIENNINAGEATVRVTAKEGSAYTGMAEGSFTIFPREVAAADITLTLSASSFPYDGMAHRPTVTVTVLGYTLSADDFTVAYLRDGAEDACIHAGTLTVKVTALRNYTYTDAPTVNYEIAKRAATVAALDQYVDAVEGQLATGLDRVQASGLAAGHTLHSVRLKLTEANTHSIEASSAVIYDAAGNDVSDNYTVTFTGGRYHTLAWDTTSRCYDCTVCDAYLDATQDTEAPTGTLVLIGAFTAQGEAYNNTPYAGTLYSKALTLMVVDASDALSGVKSISYYRANEMLDESALAAKVWRDYTEGGVSVDAENGQTVFLYVRLTDTVGNVTYLSADPVVMDMTPATVSGITNGETYYVTQSVTLQDAISGLVLVENTWGWDATSLLGEKTASLTLTGNCEATYSFTLSDVAGNMAVVYRVTMRPIAALSADIDHLTPENVTALDVPTLRDVLDKVTRIKTSDATEAEKAALQAIIDKCNTLLARVQDIEEALVYFGDLLAGYDAETVTSADRADIVFIRESIRTLEAGNVTEEQREQLAEMGRKAEELLTRIDEVAAELQRLREEGEKYDITTVTTEDRAALQALEEDIEALLATTNLTAVERAELEALYEKISAILDEVWRIKDEIDRLTEALDAYTLPTVKSTDTAAIEAIAIEIDDLLSSYGLTEEETSALQALADKAAALLEKIEAVAEELRRVSNTAGRYDIDTATTKDIPALKTLQADMLALLGGDNLTAGERAPLISLRYVLEDVLARVTGIEAEIARITAAVNGYEATKVGLADKKDIETLIADIDALLTYQGNLLEEEKTALADLRARAEALLASIGTFDQGMVESLLDALYAYDMDTVKSIDEEPITGLLREIRSLLETDLPNEEDRAALDEGILYAEALLAEIQKNLDELARLIAAANAYDINTVKSTDRAAIEQLVRDMDALAATEHLTDSERESLAEARAFAEALLARIEAAASAPITDSTQAAAKLNKDNYALSDKATLEQAKADIEKALQDYDGNYTEEEKAALRGEIARIEEILHSIARVEAVQDAIGMIPDRANIKNPEIAEIVDAIEDAYAQLTDHEKTLVDRSKLDELLGIGKVYEIVSGKDSTWQKGTDYALPFGANGEFAKFTGVKVDGVLLDAQHYIAVARDTVVNLTPTYLETLALGPHTLTILYEDGEASCNFTIRAAREVDDNPYLWLIILIIILCVIGGAVAVYIVMNKERNTGRR